MARKENPSTRSSLMEAAFAVIRAKGYSATTVDDICAEAGVSKGAFFHHFTSKEALAVAAAQHWSDVTGEFFAAAPYQELDDPLERVLGYVSFRKEIVQGSVPEFTCLVGTMTQEAYGTSPAIQAACRDSIFGHAATLIADIEAAMARHDVDADFTAESLALHTQAVLQGAFILAKASGEASRAIESIEHLHRYLTLLFTADTKSRPEQSVADRRTMQ
ncbi:TetR/AcrR family transcriptional regulator [Oricola cellulosilytica]|uniref:TetR/AcrR family transcriptional regulator n=1 Tax=Oricola cellulosilytica TaxID=1429082 RepID=A0A4V2MNR8_9HYPH|nr:TetR/AcrR family transcriptional regulator [Oricola cellulosilytica]TCD14237.1 TetR/AcrR family transcriptional regulator [Oricola cellulosilytica]